MVVFTLVRCYADTVTLIAWLRCLWLQSLMETADTRNAATGDKQKIQRKSASANDVWSIKGMLISTNCRVRLPEYQRLLWLRSSISVSYISWQFFCINNLAAPLQSLMCVSIDVMNVAWNQHIKKQWLCDVTSRNVTRHVAELHLTHIFDFWGDLGEVLREKFRFFMAGDWVDWATVWLPRSRLCLAKSMDLLTEEMTAHCCVRFEGDMLAPTWWKPWGRSTDCLLGEEVDLIGGPPLLALLLCLCLSTTGL